MECYREGQVKVLGKHVVNDHVVESVQDRRHTFYQTVDQAVKTRWHLALLQHRARLRHLRVLRIHLWDQDKACARRKCRPPTSASDDGDRVSRLNKHPRVCLDHSLHAPNDRRGGVVQNGSLWLFPFDPSTSLRTDRLRTLHMALPTLVINLIRPRSPVGSIAKR